MNLFKRGFKASEALDIGSESTAMEDYNRAKDNTIMKIRFKDGIIVFHFKGDVIFSTADDYSIALEACKSGNLDIVAYSAEFEENIASEHEDEAFQNLLRRNKYKKDIPPFKINLNEAPELKDSLKEGEKLIFESKSGKLSAFYIGRSRIDAFAMFHPADLLKGDNLSDIFDGERTTINGYTITSYPCLIPPISNIQ